MTLRNNKGQTTVALVIVVGLIAFILISNLQKQTLFVARKVIEMKVQSEGEAAVSDFALKLYNAYVQAAAVPDLLQPSFQPVPTISYKTTADPKYNIDFVLNGNKLCAARMRLLTNNDTLDICIELPKDFVTLLHRQQLHQEIHSENQFYFVNLMKQSFSSSLAWAQTQPAMAGSRPDPGNSPPPLTVSRTPFSASIISQYDQYNCDNPVSRIACVKIKICLKISACTEAEKIKQTFVFLRVPTTQLRE